MAWARTADRLGGHCCFHLPRTKTTGSQGRCCSASKILNEQNENPKGVADNSIGSRGGCGLAFAALISERAGRRVVVLRPGVAYGCQQPSCPGSGLRPDKGTYVAQSMPASDPFDGSIDRAGPGHWANAERYETYGDVSSTYAVQRKMACGESSVAQVLPLLMAARVE